MLEERGGEVVDDAVRRFQVEEVEAAGRRAHRNRRLHADGGYARRHSRRA